MLHISLNQQSKPNNITRIEIDSTNSSRPKLHHYELSIHVLLEVNLNSHIKLPYYIFQPKFCHRYWWNIKEKHLNAIRWRDNSKLAFFNPSPGYAFVRGTATTNTPCQLKFYLEPFATMCLLLYFSFHKIYTDYTDTFDPFYNQFNRLLYGVGQYLHFHRVCSENIC